MSLVVLILAALDTSANLLADFPAEDFTILAFCDACGRQVPIERTRMPPGVTVQELRQRLRCSACGSHETQVRILYNGAGGFQYR